MEVIYVKCPHCGTGWYGEFLHTTYKEDGKTLESYMIQGINPTDISKPIKCLRCGKTYRPIQEGYKDENGLLNVRVLRDFDMAIMDDFVAERLITCRM